MGSVICVIDANPSGPVVPGNSLMQLLQCHGLAAMTQEEWFNLDSSFSFRFAMENSPEGISEELIKVMDMEVRSCC